MEGVLRLFLSREYFTSLQKHAVPLDLGSLWMPT